MSDSLNILDVSAVSPANDEQLAIDVNSPFAGEQKMSISLAGDFLNEFFGDYRLPTFGVECRDSLEL